MTEIDHEYTREIVCPYCGHEKSDSWEYFRGGTSRDEEIDCDRCERTFIATENYEVTYVTRKIEP